jgi:hypothetical protein
MAFLRTVALAAPVVALMLPGLPAHACDSNYAWLCKPVPSIDASEPTETRASKPLPITSVRKEARAKALRARAAIKSAKAKGQRSAQARVKRVARKLPARRLVLRPRHQSVAAAPPEDLGQTPGESTRITATKPRERAQKPDAASAGNAQATREANTGFVAAWEPSAGVAEPVEAAPVGAAATAATATEASAPASEPAPVMPVLVASQSEVNEIDLAAPEPAQSDGSWLRRLFIVFGGILALGSALRLFL